MKIVIKFAQEYAAFFIIFDMISLALILFLRQKQIQKYGVSTFRLRDIILTLLGIIFLPGIYPILVLYSFFLEQKEREHDLFKPTEQKERNEFDRFESVNYFFKEFSNFLDAVSKKDLDYLKQKTSPKVYQMYFDKINTLNMQKRTLVIENVKLREGHVLNLKQTDHAPQMIELKFQMICKKYQVNMETQKALNLSEKQSFLECLYHVTFEQVDTENWVLCSVEKKSELKY